jgi:hypothetical protein
MKITGTIIDLTQEIYTGMPVYPGHAKTVIWEHMSHEESGRTLGTGFSYQSSGLMMCDHGPTHIDPSAICPGSQRPFRGGDSPESLHYLSHLHRCQRCGAADPVRARKR